VLGTKEWDDILSYRNKLVESRNAQLEYKQTASQLSDRIRQACHELSKKDTRVKEGLEVLSLERQRLGYLRDELARRAEMISRWEQRTRKGPTPAEEPLANQKDIDRMNALILEQEQTRKSRPVSESVLPVPMLNDPIARSVSFVRGGQLLVEGSAQTVVEEPVIPLPPALAQEQLHLLAISKGPTPISVSVGNSVLNSARAPSSGPANPPPASGHSSFTESDQIQQSEESRNSALPASAGPVDLAGARGSARMTSTSGSILLASSGSPSVSKLTDGPSSHSSHISRPSSVEERPAVTPQAEAVVDQESPADKAPRPYPAWGYRQDEYLAEMTVCLDFLWQEYSTEVGESDRLMTLSNLMRLVADATFAAPTAAVIELFLRCVRLGSQHLIEKKYFLAVLQSVMQVSLDGEFDTVEITDLLFSEYLMPLMLRLKRQQRSFDRNHPSLGPSSIHASP
jgi:hypothetical protein